MCALERDWSGIEAGLTYPFKFMVAFIYRKMEYTFTRTKAYFQIM